MKLEHGKTYKDRNGTKHTVYLDEGRKSMGWKYIFLNEARYNSWTEEGRHCMGEASTLDIVCEYSDDSEKEAGSNKITISEGFTDKEQVIFDAWLQTMVEWHLIPPELCVMDENEVLIYSKALWVLFKESNAYKNSAG